MSIFTKIKNFFSPKPAPDWSATLKSINLQAGWRFEVAAVDPVMNPSGRTTLRINLTSPDVGGGPPTILRTINIGDVVPGDVSVS